MELNTFIDNINSIFHNNNVHLNLKSSEYEAALIENIPNTEVFRWTNDEMKKANNIINGGIINSTQTSRKGTPPNSNAATHLFIGSEAKEMFTPFINEEIYQKYSLTFKCQMVEQNLSLLLNYLPSNYYSENRINYLKEKYNESKLHYLEFSSKLTGNTGTKRLMFMSKTNVMPQSEIDFYLENRYATFEDDYVVIIKLKKEMKYLILFLPESTVHNEFSDISAIEGRLIGKLNNQPFSNSNLSINNGQNLLIFGAPGTGKSYFIKENYEQNSKFMRIVFHEEYSYQDFVGCIKPDVNKDNIPKYSFMPGPFTKILKLALENAMVSYTLIIEELNRANASSVFGDVFQLLDRDENGISEYSIENEDILNYLNTESENFYSEVRIPNNLNIVSTMNSADQGVFPLDTAFKRRWNYEYIPIEFSSWHEDNVIPYFVEVVEGREIVKYIKIRDYIETINNYLSTNEDLAINEDRLIGPYYLKKHEWESWNSKESYKKILSYLWDDVARIDRGSIFKEGLTQFIHVCTAVKNNHQVFTEELHTLLKEKSFDIGSV